MLDSLQFVSPFWPGGLILTPVFSQACCSDHQVLNLPILRSNFSLKLSSSSPSTSRASPRPKCSSGPDQVRYFLPVDFSLLGLLTRNTQLLIPCTITAVSDSISIHMFIDFLIVQSGDLSDREGYDFDQLFAIAKVQVSFTRHFTISDF